MQSVMDRDIDHILVSEEQLKTRVAELGTQISKDYAGKNLLLVSILKGSVVFMADLMRAVSIPCGIDFMVVSSYGGAMIDTDVATNIRQLFSGLVDLVIIVPLVGGLGLLGGTMSAGIPALWLAVSGLSAGASFLLWYMANSTVGCAIGMSLNVTYAFWGVLFCILFLGQPVTTTIVVGSVVIIFGAILVTMNPLDFFKKGEV